MAYALVKSTDKTTTYVVEMVADTVADIDTLPTNYAPGSTCLVIEGPSVYILNAENEWKPL